VRQVPAGADTHLEHFTETPDRSWGRHFRYCISQR
jgi:hypothetical protein